MMASRTIEAKAVISAADKTGNVFDKIAAKMKGVEKTAKSFEGIKAPQKFFGDFGEELHRLKLSEKELNGVRKSFAAFEGQLKQGPIRAQHYFRAMEEFKGKTVDHWREIKGSVDEAEKAHKRFYKTAGHVGRHAALHMIGGLGAGYLGAHAIGHIAKNAAERNREGIREEMAGFTPDQQEEANRVADEISRRHPSLSRTENLEDLRKNTARLGSLDRAKAIAEDYAKARVFLSLLGGDEHELEKVTLAGEGSGAANTPEQYRDFLHGFLKGRAVNADYRGEDYAKDYRAAMSAKYGWDKQFKETDFFTLASHTPGLGVKLATVNAAMVGSRMTPASKKALQAAGILDKNNQVVDEKGLQANLYDWTQSHFRPYFEKQGVKFGEDMSEEDKRTVSGQMTKMVSARNAADAFVAALIDSPLVEKARNRKLADVDKVDDFASRDSGVAWEAVKKQLGDFGTELASTSAAAGVMNKVASDFAAYTSWVRTGQVPTTLPGMRAGLDWLEGNSPPIEGPIPLPRGDPRRMRDGSILPMPSIDPRELPLNSDDVRLPMADPRRMRDGSRLPALPMSDPRKEEGESWQPIDGRGDEKVQVEVSASDLKGEVTQTIKIEPSPLFTAMFSRLETVISLVGKLTANGPGSAGHASPDAEAPTRPPTGNAFPGY
jgi:hypothetical protein